MSEHRATVEWQLAGEFRYDAYARFHTIDFGRGVHLAGNAAASNMPKTAPAAPGADPEQQFVASISSCHMLWFLHLACNRKFVVASYRDEVSGVLAKDADGNEAVTQVTLRPLRAKSPSNPASPEKTMPGNLIVEKRDAVAFVTLNRPEVRNAFDDVLMRDCLVSGKAQAELGEENLACSARS